jgi:rubredoxin
MADIVYPWTCPDCEAHGFSEELGDHDCHACGETATLVSEEE